MSAMHRKAGAFGYPIFVVKKRRSVLWVVTDLELEVAPVSA